MLTHITDINSLENLDALPPELFDAILNSEIELIKESTDTPLLNSLYIRNEVLDFITDTNWASAPVCILTSKANLQLDADGQVWAEW